MTQALGPHSLKAFEATAATAAAYLDACDSGGSHIHVDPAYYRECAALLGKIFHYFEPRQHFPQLLAQSPAARELADAEHMARKLATSRLIYYPQLAALLGRASA